MAVSIAATSSLRGLRAVLFATALTTSLRGRRYDEGADFVRVVPDQMHQLEVVKVEALRVPRSAIGDRPDRIQ